LIGIHTDAEFEFEKKRYQGGFSTYNMTVQFFQLIAKEDQRIIGWCGFHSWTQQHRRAELFYILKEDKDKRKGLMTEAVTEVLKYGKEVMNLRRIEAFVGINNSASFQLLEKFGFQKEATIKHRYLFDEKVEWDYLYSLLPNEM
jgi:ribosomal-protein-alanine N-acetyltransferase